MEEPFFGITTTVDCTKAYNSAKEFGVSFFVYYLHKTLLAVNAIEPFRYRIIEGDIYLFNVINASATIMREDETFGFSFMEFTENLRDFEVVVQSEISRIQNTSGLLTREFPENLIHFSALPWINFTSFSHARSFTFEDSCPKISFGKMMVSDSGIRTMSMSVHVHHGLMDGLHVGQFVDCFQELMNE
jgi:chloramphenicol O-acetyltransferase type A